ncbi:uncharacterized protein DC041_0010624, partial [Schistosoma bovis]
LIIKIIFQANYFNTSLISLFYVLHYKIICILIISGSGLFMLSEEANFMILRKTIKLFVKHVVPSSSNYGNGVGKLIMTITQNLCIAVFTFSLSNLLIEDHLKDFLSGLMTEYVSLRSGTPASLFTASVMVMVSRNKV